MNRLLTLLKYGLFSQFRSRWLIIYALFYFGVSFALLRIGTDSRKGIASLINVVILINPAVAILHSSVSWYAASNFNQLLLMQPVKRSWLLLSAWMAVALGLTGAFALGVGSAFAISGILQPEVCYLLLVGTLLNFVFAGLGVLSACICNDRIRGIGAALGIWLYFSMVHDGLVFLFLMNSHDYPVEGVSYALMALNPIDLSRLLLLIKFDFAALLGYTGSLLQRMAGSPSGIFSILLGITVWAVVPIWAATYIFRRKDL